MTLDGVSVVICSYNGALRLPPVLAHLARQDPTGDIPWEVIVVDNASTDDTAAVARREWPRGHCVPLRVIAEPRLGLAWAKERGLSEARYELVSFVDDDSWVCPGWVRTVADACARHPEAGAVRGDLEAAFDTVPPPWFESFKGYYSLGPNLPEACDITEAEHPLCGDGMTLRKAAWLDLRSKGFSFAMSGRRGDQFNGVEDLELALALRLAGWRLWYDPHLRLQQWLPPAKLEWRLLRGRLRDMGAAWAALEPYALALRALSEMPSSATWKLLDRMPMKWLWRVLLDLRLLARRPLASLLGTFFDLEGSQAVLIRDGACGRIGRLLAMRGRYDSFVREILNREWR